MQSITRANQTANTPPRLEVFLPVKVFPVPNGGTRGFLSLNSFCPNFEGLGDQMRTQLRTLWLLIQLRDGSYRLMKGS